MNKRPTIKSLTAELALANRALRMANKVQAANILRITTLEIALRPFAEAGKRTPSMEDCTNDRMLFAMGNGDDFAKVTYGHIRAAADAYARRR